VNGRLKTLEFLLDWGAEDQSRLPEVFSSESLLTILRNALYIRHEDKNHREVVGIVFKRLNLNELPSGDLAILLQYAVMCDNPEVVAALIAHGKCDVNQHEVEPCAGKAKGFPLISKTSDPDVIRLLIDAKAEVDNPKIGGLMASDQKYETVFATACTKLRVDSVKVLLEAKADVNGGGNTQATALQHAIRAPCTDDQVKDKFALIKLLIESGAHTRGFIRGSTVLQLILAVQTGGPSHLAQHSYALGYCMDADDSCNRVITAKTLLRHDPKKYSCNGTTLLFACNALHRDPAVFRVLINGGDKVNAYDTSGHTILSRLLTSLEGERGAHPPRATQQVLLMLLDAGADPRLGSRSATLMMILSSGDSMNTGRYMNCYTDSICSILISDILESILHRPVITQKKRKRNE
jgi:hypothetical protein